MLFNSIEFAIFLPIVFILYWFITNRNLKLQNSLLLIVSYFFYGWWDYRFLSLIAFSSIVDYIVGLKLSKTDHKGKRKILLLISIMVNMGFLGFFKYYNFFAENFAQAFTLMGQDLEVSRLNVILPVGISFYTFQTLSYTIDIYKKKIPATKDAVAFFAFVSFFPQLVAGPIERAANLLPQFYKKRKFEYSSASDGMRQIIWGLFKKIVIADNCSFLVNEIFGNHTGYPPLALVLGAILFAFQIYGDFSGYSDIAIGTARLFGFNLMRNFAFPYFSRDIAEFWRRWHISLSTWFRDYLYIPLGGSKGTRGKVVRNTFIIFVVSGFWHGANWTFIVWGALNAVYFLPLLLLKRNRKNTDTVAARSFLPSLWEFLQIGTTFLLTCMAWVFFRAESIGQAFSYLGRIISGNWLELVKFPPFNIRTYMLLLLIGVLIVVEWINRKRQFGLEISYINRKWLRWGIYFLVVFAILTFGVFNKTEFIYFAF